jgi:peptide/nickel transport system permease protein
VTRVASRLRWPYFARSPSGRVGLALLALFVLLAVLGPTFAPHPLDAPVGAPGQPPSGAFPLGTDELGRDVLSRVLNGGGSVLGLAGLATALTYAIGISVGLIAGYSRSLVDSILMRTVDLFLSFPALLLLLLLVTGLGSGIVVLIVGTALVLFPGVSRIVRSATLEVSVRGYVEAAAARGEPTGAILGFEILPNIVSRFGGAIILIASLNYLNLGLQPPAADWALMISENREVISLNIWAVLVPSVLLGLLTVAVNLVGDAYARSRGESEWRP